MTVKGLGNAGIPTPDPRRTDGANGGKRAGAVSSADQNRTTARLETSADADVLELSVDALHGRNAAGVPPRDTLLPERIKEIATRIADGSYDRRDVQDIVLDRLASHLDTLGDTTT